MQHGCKPLQNNRRPRPKSEHAGSARIPRVCFLPGRKQYPIPGQNPSRMSGHHDIATSNAPNVSPMQRTLDIYRKPVPKSMSNLPVGSMCVDCYQSIYAFEGGHGLLRTPAQRVEDDRLVIYPRLYAPLLNVIMRPLTVRV